MMNVLSAVLTLTVAAEVKVTIFDPVRPVRPVRVNKI
jgi:hypothetical protein